MARVWVRHVCIVAALRKGTHSLPPEDHTLHIPCQLGVALKPHVTCRPRTTLEKSVHCGYISPTSSGLHSVILWIVATQLLLAEDHPPKECALWLHIPSQLWGAVEECVDCDKICSHNVHCYGVWPQRAWIVATCALPSEDRIQKKMCITAIPPKQCSPKTSPRKSLVGVRVCLRCALFLSLFVVLFPIL